MAKLLDFKKGRFGPYIAVCSFMRKYGITIWEVIGFFKYNYFQQKQISAESHNKYIRCCILEVSVLIVPEQYCSGRDTARCFGWCDLGNIKSLLAVNAAEE